MNRHLISESRYIPSMTDKIPDPKEHGYHHMDISLRLFKQFGAIPTRTVQMIDNATLEVIKALRRQEPDVALRTITVLKRDENEEAQGEINLAMLLRNLVSSEDGLHAFVNFCHPMQFALIEILMEEWRWTGSIGFLHQLMVCKLY